MVQREIHVEAEDLVFPVRNGITHTGQFQVLSTHSLSRFMGDGWRRTEPQPLRVHGMKERSIGIFGVNGIESSAST